MNIHCHPKRNAQWAPKRHWTTALILVNLCIKYATTIHQTLRRKWMCLASATLIKSDMDCSSLYLSYMVIIYSIYICVLNYLITGEFAEWVSASAWNAEWIAHRNKSEWYDELHADDCCWAKKEQMRCDMRLAIYLFSFSICCTMSAECLLMVESIFFCVLLAARALQSIAYEHICFDKPHTGKPSQLKASIKSYAHNNTLTINVPCQCFKLLCIDIRDCKLYSSFLVAFGAIK